jgi:hypothetical protein
VAAAALYPKVDRAVVSLLSKAGWSWGCVSAIDCEGRAICYYAGKAVPLLLWIELWFQ